MRICNEPLFVNDYQTFYCGLEEGHKKQHVAMIPFGEDPEENICNNEYFELDNRTYYFCQLEKNHKGKHKHVSYTEWK